MALENHSKSLVWRRSLVSPKFPNKEAEFSADLQEWEADLERYTVEYGPTYSHCQAPPLYRRLIWLLESGRSAIL